ncbi:MAG: type IV secretory system conjugative DNA transfer family protein [Acidiferrobacter sp.]
MARWRSPLFKARDRAERRRLRALIDVGELIEAHGFLGRRTELIRRLSGSPAAPSSPSAPGVGTAPAARRPLSRPRPRSRPRWGRVVITVFWPFAWLVPFAARIGRSREAPMMSVWLGDATGLLARRGRYHRWRGAPVILARRDWNQNLLVLGGIGSGKTTSVIQPVLWQALGQGVGGLIFDIKGDFGAAVSALCHQRQRPLTVIGPRRTAFNLLRGLTPETAASFLRSALLLTGTPGDPFWIDTAVELCRNALGVLSFMPEHYSLAGLYEYLFQDHARTRLDAQLQAECGGLSPQALRLLRSYQAYHEGVFTRFDAKVVAGVLASAAQVLTPFTHPELIDAFCPAVDTVTVDGLGRGELVLIDLPLSVWGTGAKVIYTFLKLRFFSVYAKTADRRPTAPGAVCVR